MELEEIRVEIERLRKQAVDRKLRESSYTAQR